MYKRAWSTREHGKSWDLAHQQDHPPGFRWLIESFGSNWRLTGPQAAIGLCQLSKLTDWHMRRSKNAAVLHDRLAQIPCVRFPLPNRNVEHAFYRAYCFVDPKLLSTGSSRDTIMQQINDAGWPCGVGSCPEIYLEPALKAVGYGPTNPLPIARELGLTSLAFLVHPTIEYESMLAYADCVGRILESAC